ncbi:MAG: hypothetical protein IJR04_08435 [Bacteroidales bacterium]|nr:hypothetical protein [Bacteroidales bacterium]MBQ6742583.1 hypothetical protein [Bacteroidales bacterium]MBQ6742590.1 hypothetical protein [Bacteroidales bacterium]
MSQKVLGIDLGTNSLGICLRNPDNGKNIVDQQEFFGVTIFKSGVGRDDKGEFSYAAIRTSKRSARRLYQARKYRIWATLQLLVDDGFCPMTQDELNQWKVYDKEKGYFRKYPVGAVPFEQWVRLDFNGDGKPDYSSPYQLRAELIENVLDMTIPENRYKFGRAMYHIAQRRGFKSSKGETLKEAKEDVDVSNIEITSELKKSEEKKSKTLVTYMEDNGFCTVGLAFAHLEREGVRVRNSEYQAVRSQYMEEVDLICKKQGLDRTHAELYRKLVSTKRGEGTIFYKRPLRSQKGLVGYCTLEPNSRRCPESHPEYELFRAYSFINNIKYRIDNSESWKSLDDKQRESLFNSLFTRVKSTFKFQEIREWLEKNVVSVPLSYKQKTINYQDYVTVAGCPVVSRLKKILGDDWMSVEVENGQDRTSVNKVTGEIVSHRVKYNYEDLWHLCYTCDDMEDLAEIIGLKETFDSKKKNEMMHLWGAMREGYATLSLKAIRKILPFLKEGMLYNEAVSFAKLPEILGEEWEKNKESIIESLRTISKEASRCRQVCGIANALIGDYKANEDYVLTRNEEYLLDDGDKKKVTEKIIDTISQKRWDALGIENQILLQKEVEDLLQKFFYTKERSYYRLPKANEIIKDWLAEHYPHIKREVLDTMYHHSQIDRFAKGIPQTIEVDGKLMSVMQLGTPDIGSIKNPAVMRALYALRNNLNHLLREGMIDEETRLVVETAREMNDANWRRAIELYQKEREKENEAIANIIKEFRPGYSDEDIDKGRLLFEQNIVSATTKEGKIKAENFAKDMTKYKLYQEQKFRCIYTGKSISLNELFNDNVVDIEHTVPRSISFDNSLANKTICDASYNRKEKKNQIPSQLGNYNAILENLKPWEETLKHTEKQIEIWRDKAKTAATVDYKNKCIQQQHLWQLEHDYWQAKLKTFYLKEEDLTSGFKHSQLVDTRIITKYAFHYLKTLFERVDVQRGEMTAVFRKILGIQSVDERKDRSRHSHHAVDAAVLALIPESNKRDALVKLFYDREEAKKNHDEDGFRKYNEELQLERKKMFRGDSNALVKMIENDILINHTTKDQCLTPAYRKRRIGGKLIKGEDGKEQWVRGDSIRGSLHQDKFYGVISNKKELRVVVRKELNGSNGLLAGFIKEAKDKKKFDEAFGVIVDKRLGDMIRLQLEQLLANPNCSKSEILATPFYMLDREGNAIKQGKTGSPISPIRHVRCYARAGRGELRKDTLLTIKNQTYISKQEYKRTYYAQTDDNYLCLLYEGAVKGSIQREMNLISLFEMSCIVRGGVAMRDVNALRLEPAYSTFGKNKLPLRALIKRGTKVIFYDKMPEEVNDYDKETMSKHLYVVYKFNNMGTATLYLKRHIEARTETQCEKGEKGTIFDSNNAKSYLTLKANGLKALIEGVDFTVDAVGNIVML